jgi:hypothetical protein
MRDVTPVNVFTDPVTVCEDGDPGAQSSWQPTAQQLTNRTENVNTRLATLETDLGFDAHKTASVAADSSATRPAITAAGGNGHEGISGTGGTTAAGVKGTGGPTNGNGVAGQGVGSGDGVHGTGGNSGEGCGVRGVGGGAGGNGEGVIGETTLATGIGVHGRHNTNGAGIGVYAEVGSSAGDEATALIADSTATNGRTAQLQGRTSGLKYARLYIQPNNADPTGPNLIGDMYVTTAGVLKICTVAGTPGTWVSVGSQT